MVWLELASAEYVSASPLVYREAGLFHMMAAVKGATAVTVH